MGKHKPKKEKKAIHQENGVPSHDSKETNHAATSIGVKIIVILSVIGFGVLHRHHVATLFENDRHFSHLSSLEREMTFRTEMGLYYSYYKTIINAPSFASGFHQIMFDNITEYPDTINTLKRFNLYPEVILGAMYRVFTKISDTYGYKSKECWQTERGRGMEPIISCEGMGDPFYFYVNHVFLIAGVVAGALFLYGFLLSESILGGLLAVAGFFFNHGEATRVMWTPPLRESFGYPIFLLQMLLVSYVVKYKLDGVKWSIAIASLVCSFMMSWQFAQFALSTQVFSLFVAYMLDYIPSKVLRTITFGLLTGFVVGFAFLFGNEMLLTSFFLSSLITIQVICAIESLLYCLKLRILIWVAQSSIFALGTLGLKFLIGHLLQVKDDAHIFNILKSKFTDYADFDTRLYTCAIEFDFMLPETLWKLCYTLLLPAFAIIMLLVTLLLLKQEWPYLVWWKRDPHKQFSEVIYNTGQVIAFTILAVIIMRLKLFWTPHLCVVISLLASPKLAATVSGGKIRPLWQQAAVVALLAAMSFEGVKNLKTEWGIIGEYANEPQEKLFDWIDKATPKDAVFAATMPVSANLKLSTLRPIVIHPHYEDAGLRDRVKKVYGMFSRKPHEEVYETLKKMGVNYVVWDPGWCMKGGKPGCSLPELFDLDDVSNRHRTSLCDHFQKGNFGPFKLVFRTDQHMVFKLD